MKSEWMKTRHTKYSAYVTVYILVVLAVLVGVNYLASQYSKSADLTANKRYTLSDQTIKVVKNLKDQVDIYYFDEPRNFAPAKDLLDRYDAISSKLKVHYIDALKNRRMAMEYGVKAAGTIILQHGERRGEARSLTEEEITSGLIRLLKTGDHLACFATGAGEHTLAEDYSNAKDALEKNNYRTQAINLLEKPEIPSECTLVVVAGPRYDYPQPAVDALKNYVEKGGRGLFMLDPPLEMGKTNISANEGLDKVLASWGVTLDKDLILDLSGQGGLYGMGPDVALTDQYGSHAIVKEMKGTGVAFPIVRSLAATSGASSTSETIVSSSDSSVATTQLSGKGIKIDPSKSEKKSYPVAAAGTYRIGAPGKEGRFVVVGCSGWASNSAIRFVGNRDLFLNVMSWLSNDEDLISIRPKDPVDKRLEITRAQLTLLRLVSQFLIPLGVILAGILVWLRRR
jgi:ABC-type uncharacterized transport system involved in gliding motility auxiliary subunit